VKVEELSKINRSVILVSEAAHFIGCDPRTISRAVKCGTINGFRLGRRIYIPVRTFQDLLEGRQSV
jgi:hypothetical protein